MQVEVTVVLSIDHDQDPDEYDLRADLEAALTGLSLTEDHHSVIDGVSVSFIDVIE